MNCKNQTRQPEARLPVIRQPRTLLFALTLCTWLGAGAGQAQWFLRQATPDQPQGKSIQLIQVERAWQVELQDQKEALPQSMGAQLTDLRALGQGWVAAAVGSAADGQKPMLWKGRDTQVELLPLPQVAPSSVVLQPNPLVRGDNLAGVVWIEGVDARQGAVKFASWVGAGWSASQTVAGVGPGTQTALRAVTLADGSFLAVWSAFDGEDDEIVWSRFDGNSWSPAQTLTANQVPDITPTLKATTKGAVLVWSFYDGNDYRLQAASWNARNFEATQIFGGKGSTFPTFVDTPELVLVARQAVPAAWQILLLDDAGKAKGWVEEPSTHRQRIPRVVEADAHRVVIQSADRQQSLAWNPFAE